MLNLNSYLTADKTLDIYEYTDLRFSNKKDFTTPEALALYEQRYMPVEKIKELCEKAYGCELFEPIVSFVPNKIVESFRGSGSVPVTYQPMKKILTVVYLPEIKHIEVELSEHEVHYLPTTIYYYLKHYQELYGTHSCMKEIPAKMLFDFIVKEATELRAADMTISNFQNATIVYYNCRKSRVDSNFLFSRDTITELIKFLTLKSPMTFDNRNPKAVDVDLNEEYRGRVLINHKFGGYTITIRLLPRSAFYTNVTDLNLTKETIDWLLENFMDSEKGLRLIVGETMSGKNTVALSLLKKLVETNRYKVVSVEMPVEQYLLGIEQINCTTVDEYVANIRSLIRMNPDFVYITEIQDATGLATMQVANTGKNVLSTLHANSVSDAITRLMDITGLTVDRVIQSLHSIVYQELVRDDKRDLVIPKDRYIRFTSELKYKLYGKPLGEVLKTIQDYEEGDVWIYSQLIAQ